MSAAALRQYRRLARELLLTRELAGGSLPQDVEAERADELDLHWRNMSNEERRIIEDELVDRTLTLPVTADAPQQLVAGDVLVGEHAHTPPRRP